MAPPAPVARTGPVSRCLYYTVPICQALGPEARLRRAASIRTLLFQLTRFATALCAGSFRLYPQYYRSADLMRACIGARFDRHEPATLVTTHLSSPPPCRPPPARSLLVPSLNSRSLHLRPLNSRMLLASPLSPLLSPCLCPHLRPSSTASFRFFPFLPLLPVSDPQSPPPQPPRASSPLPSADPAEDEVTAALGDAGWRGRVGGGGTSGASGLGRAPTRRCTALQRPPSHYGGARRL